MKTADAMHIKAGILPPLCGHTKPLRLTRSYKLLCPECGSFWDSDFINTHATYDRSYPERRSHFDPAIGTLKVRTLRHWIRKLGICTLDLAVCEVGFGAGFCLSYLRDESRRVFGVEAVRENIEHAVRLGIERDSLYYPGTLPAAVAEHIDLWIFQDSFEHLDDPRRFLAWMTENSSAQSKVLVVAPNGASPSERILRRWWPHKLSDHRFHWSRAGLIDFFSRNGFIVDSPFFPAKYVSLKMLLAHATLKAGGPKWIEQWLQRLPVPEYAFLFNIGETGLLFRKA